MHRRDNDHQLAPIGMTLLPQASDYPNSNHHRRIRLARPNGIVHIAAAGLIDIPDPTAVQNPQRSDIVSWALSEECLSIGGFLSGEGPQKM